MKLTIGRAHYREGLGSTPGRPAPHITVVSGRTVVIAVSIEAPNGVHVGDVWLTVSGSATGLGRGRPSGQYKLLTHEGGPLAATHQVVTSWAAASLFRSNTLILTMDLTLGTAELSTTLAKFDVTP